MPCGPKKKRGNLDSRCVGPLWRRADSVRAHPPSCVYSMSSDASDQGSKNVLPAIRCFDWKIEVSDHLHFYEGFNEISVNRLYKIVDILSYFAYPSAYSAGSANVNFGNPS